MTYLELIEVMRKEDFFEIRNDIANRFEAVVRMDKLKNISSHLNGYFKAPLKAAGAIVADEAKRLTAPYGGIQDNQTLYYQNDGASFSLAMIWPWSNGIMATVIIVCGVMD